jgi:hypothetical protein
MAERDRSHMATSTVASDRIEREACQFLDREVAPALTRARRAVLANAVRGAANRGALAPLGRLPERQRRELLQAIEARVESSRGSPSPSALVRLTSVIAASPRVDPPLVRGLASPAR